MASQSITFHDNYKAPLTAGSYRLVLQQSVTLEGEDPRHYYRDQRVDVLAPRYSIEADDIQAYFPPAGGTGDYGNTLAHLVFDVALLRGGACFLIRSVIEMAASGVSAQLGVTSELVRR